MIIRLDLEPVYSDEWLAEQEGKYFDETYYNHIIREDTDVYCGDKLLLKFRKGVLPKEECSIVFKNLKSHASIKKDNRGSAAGLLDISRAPKYVSSFNKVSKYNSKGYYNKDGKLINNTISNLSPSNIIGFFDRPDRNLGKNAPKCRLTSFTKTHFKKWTECIPYLIACDKLFKELIYDKWLKQYNRSRLTDFYIDNTSFSTVTCNLNFRTALHKDSGDYIDGFGIISVIEEGIYEGGYLGLLKYGVAVDIRTTDLLLFDPHEFHSNTETIGENYSRLSLVCYLREDMIKCTDISILEQLSLLNALEEHM